VIPLSALSNVNLQPGELYLAADPAILETILGSCVAATFWSKRLHAGALCHGVLPRCPDKVPLGFTSHDGHRYVDFSIRYLLAQFELRGARREELEIKLFGGADVLPVYGNGSPTVGALNCAAALEVLQEEGLTALARDLRGANGRRIHFHTGTGEVLVHRLMRSM
jgi:chemotaxis protein CheD